MSVLKRILFFLIFIILIITGILFLPYGNMFRHVSVKLEEKGYQGSSGSILNSLAYNFEVDPKDSIPSDHYKGIAHSGFFSGKVFGMNSHSLTIEKKVSELGNDNLNEIALSSWVYIFPTTHEINSALILAVSNGLGINVVVKKIKVKGNELPEGKWFKVSGLFDLSDIKMKPDYKVQLYFWNYSFTDILVDDFYIVFGGPKPRRGDSTLVNLGGGSQFTPRFNLPPYPFHLFDKVDINNRNSSFLINNGKVKDGDISPYDKIFSGHFISSGTEDLLVINKSGRTDIYTFCKERGVFSKVTTRIPADMLTFFQSADIISGCFSGGGTSQVLLSGPYGILVGEFEKPGNPCSGKFVTVSFKTLLNTTINPLSQHGQLIAADLDGDKITEILTIAENGSWKVLRFEKGSKYPWLMMASGQSDEMKQWNSQNINFNITPGRFLQKYPQDLLLSISSNKSRPVYVWSILRFDPVSHSFLSCFGEKQNYRGKTIGLDTLKPSDKFLTGTFDNSGKVKVFRYNRDWRFDLKEIRFNDTTFQIIANMDFSRYEKDFNPKYYEILGLCTARMLDPDLTSLLVIGKNCKTRDYRAKECKEFDENPALPGTLGVYSLRKTEK
jgi:hypothetical protein